MTVDPENIGCSCNLGIAYAYKGQYQRAVDALEKVMYKEGAPSRGVMFFNLGSMYERMNNAQEVRNYYDFALSLLPYFSQVYSNLGARYYMNNEPEKGLSYVTKANLMDSYMPDIQPNLTVVGSSGYITVGVVDKKAIPLMYLYHSPAWHFTLVINYMEQNKLDNASIELDKVEQALDKESILESDKRAFSQLHVYRANLWLLKGDWNRAFEEFNKGYKINPDDLGAICGLALVYFKKNDYDSVLKYYNLGASINPNQPIIIKLRKMLKEEGKL